MADPVVTTDIVPVTGDSVRLGNILLDRPEDVLKRGAEIASVLKDLIDRRGLYTMIGGKQHVRVEGWSTLGSMLGFLPKEEWVKEIEGHRGYEAYVSLVRAGDGVVVGGASAMCTRDERNWLTRDDFALRSMAITRAVGKAYRLTLSWIIQLAGYSPTPAEEMDQVIEGTARETSPKGDSQPIPSSKTETTPTSGTTSSESVISTPATSRQKNQWEQDVLKTLKSMGLVDSPQHLVAILNRSPFMDIPYGELQPYDAAVYLAGWHAFSGAHTEMTTDQKNPVINKLYLDGAPKEWVDAAERSLGMME